MGWKNFKGGGGGGQQNNNDSQIDNMIVQSSVAFQLSPIMNLISETGNLTDRTQKISEQSARLMIISLMKFAARQCENKIFSKEDNERFWKMSLDDLMSELSFYEGLAGMLMARDAPQTNFFSKLEKYWLKVLENKRNYISNDQSKYKIIIVGADKVTQQDVDDADEITEDALEDLKTRKDIVLKPQPSKIKKPVETAPKTQDEAETKEMPKESIESLPEAQNVQEKVV